MALLGTVTRHFHLDNWGTGRIMGMAKNSPITEFRRTMVDYQIGDGRRFYLWQDPWHHLGPLNTTFPRGPRLLGLEESSRLSAVIQGGDWHWPPITDSECLEITHTLPTIHGGEDRIIWRFEHGQPTTQALYRLFDPPRPKVDWSSLLSGSLKIPRHLFILWLTIQCKLATTDKPWLAHLGPYALCDEGATETHGQLFFQCRFSRQCLTAIRREIRFSWPNGDWTTDIRWASQKWRGKHIINISYHALLAACVYHIWKERNLRRFEHTERTPNTMALLIVEDIRQRILSISLPRLVSTRALYRLWRIPWPENGGSWGWRKLLHLLPYLRPVVEYQIGNREIFYIWQEPWHHLGPLNTQFPRGPRLLGLEESAKHSSVITNGAWQWPPITDFECLEITHNLPQIHGDDDRVIWRLEGRKPTTQDLYRLFDPPGPKVGWASLLSGSLKIPRHSFILWLAILGKLPTTDKPWLSHLVVCTLCDEGATESHSPLFFRCKFSRQCLIEVHRRVRFHWPNRDWLTDIQWATRKWSGRHIINIAYRALLASCVYHIWRERNLRRFEQTELTPSTMGILIVDDVKQRIISIKLTYSDSTRVLYRL
ncbi:UNVERIFIED_CONTAM: hypothetical protein Sindi_1289500 [Sesamum indicum]